MNRIVFKNDSGDKQIIIELFKKYFNGVFDVVKCKVTINDKSQISNKSLVIEESDFINFMSNLRGLDNKTTSFAVLDAYYEFFYLKCSLNDENKIDVETEVTIDGDSYIFTSKIRFDTGTISILDNVKILDSFFYNHKE